MYFFLYLGAGTYTGSTDMGFPIGGGANCGGGGSRWQFRNDPDFGKKCIKLTNVYCVWAAHGVASFSEILIFPY